MRYINICKDASTKLNYKPIFQTSHWRLKKEDLKMASPDKWLFYVDSTSQGQVCFKLALYPEKRRHSGLSSLGSSLRYFMTGYPVNKSWTAKNPEFACQERAALKSLASSGYRQVWSIYGGLIEGSSITSRSGDAHAVEHMVGRKRRRQPTINQEEEVAGQTATDKGIEQQQHLGYKHGLLIGLPHEKVVEYRIEIGQILEKYGFKTGIEFKKIPDEQWMCEYGGQSFQLVKGISGTAEVAVPVHPAFRDTESNLVFHSLDHVLEVLEKCPAENCFQEMRRLVHHLEDDGGSDLCLQHPFVVIEGLDATGKTTLVNKLADRLGAIQLHTPPESLFAIRQQFNDQPTLFRRVYYTFANYLVGKEVVQNCASRPVIMDRYWHSTAAYTIAAQCSGDLSSLPPPDSYLYQWPKDMPRPTLVLLLSVSEDERERRMAHRLNSTGEQLSKEEVTLQNRLMRERILGAYRRMQNPGVVEICADGSREEVMESVLLQLKTHHIL